MKKYPPQIIIGLPFTIYYGKMEIAFYILDLLIQQGKYNITMEYKVMIIENLYYAYWNLMSWV